MLDLLRSNRQNNSHRSFHRVEPSVGKSRVAEVQTGFRRRFSRNLIPGRAYLYECRGNKNPRNPSCNEETGYRDACTIFFENFETRRQRDVLFLFFYRMFEYHFSTIFYITKQNESVSLIRFMSENEVKILYEHGHKHKTLLKS